MSKLQQQVYNIMKTYFDIPSLFKMLYTFLHVLSMIYKGEITISSDTSPVVGIKFFAIPFF